MDGFYNRNVTAFFIGDGKDTLRQTCRLHSKHGIDSVVFDSRLSLFSRFCPFIKAVSSASAKEDSLFLDLIDSEIEKCGKDVILLFPQSADSKRLLQANEDFFQTRFICDGELISDALK